MAENLLFIEDRHIQSMLRDARFAAIPCIDSMRRVLDGKLLNCGRCQAKKKRAYTDAITNTKNCLTGLRGAQLKQLKDLLGARQLRVIKRNSRGGKVQVTF